MSTENISPPKRRRKRRKESKPKREVGTANLKILCASIPMLCFLSGFACLHYLPFSIVVFSVGAGIEPRPSNLTPR